MSKGMPIKDALKQFEEETGEKAATAKIVKMIGKIPMIEKMDASLSQLEVGGFLFLISSCSMCCYFCRCSSPSHKDRKRRGDRD